MAVQSIAAELGRVIHKHRVASGLSQERLAERSALHWTYISQVERGRRNVSVDALRRIATALRMSAWHLLQEAEERLE